MSFGYSVGDAIQVLTLLKEEYGKWQAAPEQYKDLTGEVELLQFSLEAIQGTINNIEHPQWTTLLAEWKDLVLDVQTFTAKHGGLGTSSPRPKDRIRFRLNHNTFTSHMHKLEKTRQRLSLLGQMVTGQKVDSLYKLQHREQVSVSDIPIIDRDRDRISKLEVGAPVRRESNAYFSSSVGRVQVASELLKTLVDDASSTLDNDASVENIELAVSAIKTLVDTVRKASESQKSAERAVTSDLAASTLRDYAEAEPASPNARKSSIKTFINGFGENSSINQGGSSPYIRRERPMPRNNDASTADIEPIAERQSRRNTEGSISKRPFFPKTMLNSLGKSSHALNC